MGHFRMNRLEVESRLRLFQQLHQSIDEEWHRANGNIVCYKCGLTYYKHPVEEQYNIDHRLCDGTVVHL